MDGQLSYTPHPNPPRTEEDQLDWLRLIRSHRVGPVTFHRLLAEHGSASAALAALPEIARQAGVCDYKICPPEVALAELRAGRRASARLLLHGAADYPADLAQLADAPPLLWCLGRYDLLMRPMVAVVGARNASSAGQRMARHLALGLAQAGYGVVSGLARGIDAQAHEGALQADGAAGTIAVLAGGVDRPYPEENLPLARKIAQEGVILSEQPLGMAPMTRHFPIRNRIISGLGRAVILVEAASRSGSLITAKAALDQGREVMAVPGHPFDARAAGCNQLLREGAVLVRGVNDILEVLGEPRAEPAKETSQAPIPAPHPRQQKDILSLLSLVPMPEDQLIRELKITPQALAPLMLSLEIEGRVIRHAGGLLSLSG